MFFVCVHYTESTCPVNSNYFIKRFQFQLSSLSNKTSKSSNFHYKFQQQHHQQQQNHLGILDPTIITALMAILTLATLVSR